MWWHPNTTCKRLYFIFSESWHGIRIVRGERNGRAEYIVEEIDTTQKVHLFSLVQWNGSHSLARRRRAHCRHELEHNFSLFVVHRIQIIELEWLARCAPAIHLSNHQKKTYLFNARDLTANANAVRKGERRERSHLVTRRASADGWIFMQIIPVERWELNGVFREIYASTICGDAAKGQKIRAEARCVFSHHFIATRKRYAALQFEESLPHSHTHFVTNDDR